MGQVQPTARSCVLESWAQSYPHKTDLNNVRLTSDPGQRVATRHVLCGSGRFA
jgi:hypothetical protein